MESCGIIDKHEPKNKPNTDSRDQTQH